MESMFECMNSRQEQELNHLIKSIVKEFKPLQIFCFGSKIKSEYSFNCFEGSKFAETGDYDLLMITSVIEPEESDIQQFITKVYNGGSITILQANEEIAKTAIASDNIYMKTILEKGTVLYISENFDIARPE